MICLNKDGLISEVHPAFNSPDYNCDVGKENNIRDEPRRLEIIKYMEELKSYCNQNDLNALNQIFSDETVIITGSSIRTNKRHNVIIANRNVTYRSLSGKEMLKTLQSSFYKNIFVDDIKIEKNR